MFEPNVQKLLAELKPTDRVLEVGGWACPFNRANWQIDAEPFDTRGYYKTFGGLAYQGGDKEWFTKETWVRRDICGREPFPFADKSFEFAICSHVLEDIRDPLWVCSELIRVAKRGYIEVPSREQESCRGVERPNQVGLSHHRWLINIGNNRIHFLMKYHMIHCNWEFSFPFFHFRQLRPEQTVQWLWWDNSFDFEEVTIHGVNQQEQELRRYVQATRPYPAWRIGLSRTTERVCSLVNRVCRRLRRFIRG